MIFVTVGSQKFQMDRLLRALEQLICAGVLKEEIIAQTGYCTYLPSNMKCTPFFDKTEMEEHLRSCSLLICHAGAGSIISGSQNGKKIIVVPRRKQYGEHVDDHQLELAQAFSQGGHVLVAEDTDRLEQMIRLSETWTPTPYRSNSEHFVNIILEHL